MQPTIQTIKADSYDPFVNDEITQEEAIQRAEIPLKEFMLKQTREKDLALFLRASNSDNVSEPMDLPISVVIPAFAISELRTAFSIGFYNIYTIPSN
jgi:Flagellar biosynthesis pathway, component FliP